MSSWNSGAGGTKKRGDTSWMKKGNDDKKDDKKKPAPKPSGSTKWKRPDAGGASVPSAFRNGGTSSRAGAKPAGGGSNNRTSWQKPSATSSNRVSWQKPASSTSANRTSWQKPASSTSANRTSWQKPSASTSSNRASWQKPTPATVSSNRLSWQKPAAEKKPLQKSEKPTSSWNSGGTASWSSRNQNASNKQPEKTTSKWGSTNREVKKEKEELPSASRWGASRETPKATQNNSSRWGAKKKDEESGEPPIPTWKQNQMRNGTAKRAPPPESPKPAKNRWQDNRRSASRESVESLPYDGKPDRMGYQVKRTKKSITSSRDSSQTSGANTLDRAVQAAAGWGQALKGAFGGATRRESEILDSPTPSYEPSYAQKKKPLFGGKTFGGGGGTYGGGQPPAKPPKPTKPPKPVNVMAVTVVEEPNKPLKPQKFVFESMESINQLKRSLKFSIFAHNLGFSVVITYAVFGAFGLLWWAERNNGQRPENEGELLIVSEWTGWFGLGASLGAFLIEYNISLKRNERNSLLLALIYLGMTVPGYLSNVTLLPAVLSSLACLFNFIAFCKGETGIVKVAKRTFISLNPRRWDLLDSTKLLLFFYILVNLFLFTYRYIVFEYVLRQECLFFNGEDSFNCLSMFGPVAKGFGLTLNFNCAVILIPVLRVTLNKVATNRSKKRKNVQRTTEQSITFHKIIGLGILIGVFGHVTAHYANVAFRATLTLKSLETRHFLPVEF